MQTCCGPYTPQVASASWCSSVGEMSLSSSMQTDGLYTPQGASECWCSLLMAHTHLKEQTNAGARRQW
eukprot:6755154-Karenia_brevis.AAC.1